MIRCHLFLFGLGVHNYTRSYVLFSFVFRSTSLYVYCTDTNVFQILYVLLLFVLNSYGCIHHSYTSLRIIVICGLSPVVGLLFRLLYFIFIFIFPPGSLT